MESRIEFDINNSIKNWKLILQENGNITKDNISELESHLLDEIATLKNAGLNEEEAFIISQKRLGSIETLTSEFSKVNRSVFFSNKISLYLKGVLIFLSFLMAAELLSNTSLLLLETLGTGRNYTNFIIIVLLALFTISFFVGIYINNKNQRFDLHKITKIPTLILFVVISKILTFISHLSISQTPSLRYFYGYLYLDMYTFKIIFITILLVISYILYYKSKNKKALELIGSK